MVFVVGFLFSCVGGGGFSWGFFGRGGGGKGVVVK